MSKPLSTFCSQKTTDWFRSVNPLTASALTHRQLNNWLRLNASGDYKGLKHHESLWLVLWILEGN